MRRGREQGVLYFRNGKTGRDESVQGDSQRVKKLFVIGAGGFGRETAWLAERINEVSTAWEIEGFLDDNMALHGTVQGGYPVLGGCSYLKDMEEDVYAVVAIGSAGVKKAVAERLAGYDHVHFATLIDPSVLCSGRVEIGEGSIICAGTILTTDITVGKHVIINLDCTVGHDAVIRDYTTIYPSVNISGNVTVGEEAELGTGSQIIQGKSIGDRTVLGAGAVVINDIGNDCTAVGSPAKVVKSHRAEQKFAGGGG